MALWIILAVMTAAAALAVLVPMARGAGRAEADEAHDVSVYRDQIAEIERDLERGLIEPREAEAARTEIARRLIRAARAAETAPAATAGSGRRRLASAVAIVGVPAVALGLYLQLGTPDLPDRPLAARLGGAPERQTVDALVAQVEAHLLKNPEDGKGWDVLAPVYLRLERPVEAANAFRNAIRILGTSSRRQFGLGQALTILAGGIVTAEAHAAFEAALAAEPGFIAARMYLALALTQEGRHGEAVAAWRALVAEAKGDEPWLDTARRELAAAEKAGGIEPGAAVPTGPSAPRAEDRPPSSAEVAAAAAMSPEERKKFIEDMVGRLSTRLDAQGGSADEWARLIRALAMLGRAEEAQAAARKAHAIFAASAPERALIEELSRGLGLAL